MSKAFLLGYLQKTAIPRQLLPSRSFQRQSNYASNWQRERQHGLEPISSGQASKRLTTGASSRPQWTMGGAQQQQNALQTPAPPKAPPLRVDRETARNQQYGSIGPAIDAQHKRTQEQVDRRHEQTRNALDTVPVQRTPGQAEAYHRVQQEQQKTRTMRHENDIKNKVEAERKRRADAQGSTLQ